MNPPRSSQTRADRATSQCKALKRKPLVGATIFDLDTRAFDQARTMGCQFIRHPWNSGSTSDATNFANLCVTYGMRPLMVFDYLSGLSNPTIQSKVVASTAAMAAVVGQSFDVQCGVEVEEHDDYAALFSLATSIAGWSQGTRKFAPPILVMNKTASWCYTMIRNAYASGPGVLTPNFDLYFDWSDNNDEDATVDKNVQQAFRDVGINPETVAIAEFGMCQDRVGASQTLAVAYDRVKRRAVNGPWLQVAQFAIMDGIDTTASFGILKTDYTLSALGSAVAGGSVLHGGL